MQLTSTGRGDTHAEDGGCPFPSAATRVAGVQAESAQLEGRACEASRAVGVFVSVRVVAVELAVEVGGRGGTVVTMVLQ